MFQPRNLRRFVWISFRHDGAQIFTARRLKGCICKQFLNGNNNGHIFGNFLHFLVLTTLSEIRNMFISPFFSAEDHVCGIIGSAYFSTSIFRLTTNNLTVVTYNVTMNYGIE